MVELVVGLVELVVGLVELVVGLVELVVFATLLVAELVVGLAELVVGVTVSVAEDTFPVALVRVDELSAEALAAEIVLTPSVRMLTKNAKSLKRALRIPLFYPFRGSQTLIWDGEISPHFACLARGLRACSVTLCTGRGDQGGIL